jgi:hypothetical protein
VSASTDANLGRASTAGRATVATAYRAAVADAGGQPLAGLLSLIG